ncbi:MAG TPA: twin-arginine translocase subunit TatC [Bacillota bacterium]|nr:twin-arginine translocase subunit TatC [Bacillota bacterium]
MTVLEHLGELRVRLVLSAASVLAAAVFSFTQIERIRHLISRPIPGLTLIVLSPPEAFSAYLRLSLIAGVLLASPMLLYQALAFVFPGLYKHEKRFLLGAVAGITFFFFGGVLFAYYVAFPYAIGFFLKIAASQLEPQFNFSEYISFMLSFHLGFGLVFQLPLLFWLLGRIGLVSSAWLRRNRKFALLAILLLAALITPPDVISQMAMAVPLLFLYELGIFMVVMSERRRMRESRVEGQVGL